MFVLSVTVTFTSVSYLQALQVKYRQKPCISVSPLPLLSPHVKTIETCSSSPHCAKIQTSSECTLEMQSVLFLSLHWIFFAICNFVCSQGRKIKTTKPLPAYLMPSFKLVLPRAPQTLPPLLLIRPRSICEPKKYFCVKSAD